MNVDADNQRHKKEEHIRREKRKSRREGSKSESQREKEAKRREHAQRVLKAQKLKHSSSSHHKSQTSSSHQKGGTSTSESTEKTDESKFQALFSKRSEGFMLEFRFRNAPPRPPVGPCFVGYSLDSELSRWSRYRENTTEKVHVYKLHTEPDLGIPLASHSMVEDNYTDRSSAAISKASSGNKRKQTSSYMEEDEDEEDTSTKKINIGPEPLHPDDDALLNWKGSMGDTAAEAIQLSRDRKRAEAVAESMSPSQQRQQQEASSNTASKKLIIRRSVGGSKNSSTNNSANQSRVLQEANQSWMKKTTYIYNDPNSSVHKFTSLADAKKRNEQLTAERISKNKVRFTDPNEIIKGFSLVKNTARQHPTKKNVTPVAEYEFLPDVETWGHNYTHVVIDQPPKPSRNKTVSNNALSSAIITDEHDVLSSEKRECSMLCPSTSDSNCNTFDLVQKYDMHVTTLNDYLLFFNEDKGQVTYHPIDTRAQLSLGRPSKQSQTTVMEKREFNDEDVRKMESTIGEIDLDYANKI